MQQIREQAFKYLESIQEELFTLGNKLFATPELGFKETQTRQIMREKIAHLNKINITDNLAVTGFSAVLQETQNTQTITLLAEMDAVYQPHHFCAAHDGASHCCGHDSQMVIMYAVLKTFHDLGIQLPVNLELVFTPAEEFLDLDYRLEQKSLGKLQALSGKQELLAHNQLMNGAIIIASHSLGGNPNLDFDIGTNLAGFIIKRAKFRGKSAHAGAAPQQGINALNAANLAMNAIAYIRETFPNEDYIRVSPVIKNANLAASIIPEMVELEMYIRAATVEAIETTSSKIDNCLEGAAMAIGCSVEINNLVGYLPLRQNKLLSEIAYRNALTITDSKRILNNYGIVAASGDIGDLSLLKPTIQIGYGGYKGTIHGVDFAIDRPEVLYIATAKLVISLVCDLLDNDLALFKQVANNFTGISIDDYKQLIARLANQ